MTQRFAALPGKTKGILCLVFSTFTLAWMQALVGLLGEDFGIWQMLLVRSVVNAIVAGGILFAGGSRKLVDFLGTPSQQPFLLFRSVFSCASLTLLFYASARGAQADVAIINNLRPFFIAVLAVLFLRERPTRALFPALALAFLGTLIASRPVFATAALPLLAALASAIVSSVVFVAIRRYQGICGGMTMALHYALVCMLIALPPALAQYRAPTAGQWALLLGMGLVASVCQILQVYTYLFAPPAEISVYGYLGIPFSMLFGYLLLGQAVTSHACAGTCIILCAALLKHRWDRSEAKGQ